MTTNSKRFRNFATIVYPESAPADWINILRSEIIPFFVSPLHDRDLLEDGTPKKPHYHVMLMFDGVKTVEQVKETIVKIGGVGVEVVKSKAGYAKYLCHIGYPDKYQYDPIGVISGGGADYSELLLSKSEINKELKDMCEFVECNNILNFCDLMRYANLNNETWSYILFNHGAYVMKEYINSRWHKLQRSKE